VCDLCQAVLELGTPSEIGHRGYVVITCRTCHIPMVVLREHRMFTDLERVAIDARFGRDYKVRWEMRSIPDHGHCHLENKE